MARFPGTSCLATITLSLRDKGLLHPTLNPEEPTQGTSETFLGEFFADHRDSVPIIGARKLTQLEDNLASLTLTLTPEQVALLDEASKIDLGFPHEFYAIDMVRSFVYGGLRDRTIV